MKYQHCFDCQLKLESKLKREGKFDDWLRNKSLENQRAFLRDVEQAYEEELLRDPEVEQFVMNGEGELETWLKDKDYTEKQRAEVKDYIEKLREKVNKGK